MERENMDEYMNGMKLRFIHKILWWVILGGAGYSYVLSSLYCVPRLVGTFRCKGDRFRPALVHSS